MITKATEALFGPLADFRGIRTPGEQTRQSRPKAAGTPPSARLPEARGRRIDVAPRQIVTTERRAESGGTAGCGEPIS